jgi:NAD(P)-dependent dehydrogenase (short-subunit alcohol dehydrogenase family)
MNTTDLHGRTVVVTGAGSGIGRETALLCAQRGADLAICDVDDAGLAETEQRARANGREVIARHVDVADREQMRAFADAVPSADLLVNNAGVGLAASFEDTTLEDWDWIVSINLLGVVHGCHFFVPKLRAGGHVANVSSMAGYLPSPMLIAYSTTKFAVLGFSEALREELHDRQIGVTAICPGIINTPITRSTRARGRAADPELQERTRRLFERRNYGPEKVARNILRSVERNRVVAPISPEAWVANAMTRVSPRLSGWVVRKAAEQGQ